MFIDTHTHLLHHKYEAAPVTERLARAAAAGVAHHINIACHPSEWAKGLALAASHPTQVSTALGIHPHDAAAQPLNLAMTQLDALLTQPHVVAVGEMGLDYYYNNAPKPEQFAAFHAQLQLCQKHNLPAVIHTRDAEADTLAILAEHPGVTFVIHCFSGTRDLAFKALDLGGYISLSGILTFKKSQDIRDTAADVPLNRLLLETDAPYLAPEPHRSSVNESALMPHTAAVLAKLHGKTVEEIAHLTTQNAARLFTRLPNLT